MALPLLCALSLLCWAGGGPDISRARDDDEVLTLQEAVELALENNPDLRVSLDQLKAIQTRIEQARVYPATAFELELDKTQFIGTTKDISYGVSQLFEYPTRRGLRVSLAKADVSVSESGYELLRWELALTVKAVYQRLALSRRLAAVARENVAISEKLLQLARRRFEAGSVGKLDVLRASAELAGSTDELLVYEKEEQNLRAQLSFLLGRESSAAIEISPLAKGISAPEGIEELVELAIATRIEFRSLRNQLTTATIRQTLARSSYYPDISTALYRRQLADFADSWKYKVGIVLPVFGRGAVRGRVAEAQAEETVVLAETEAMQRRVDLEVRNALEDVRTLSKRVALYEDVCLATADEAFKIAEANYLEGETDNLELLISQQALQRTKRAYAEVLFDYNLGLIGLERAIGAELNRP